MSVRVFAGEQVGIDGVPVEPHIVRRLHEGQHDVERVEREPAVSVPRRHRVQLGAPVRRRGA